jgi:hypothetical protein
MKRPSALIAGCELKPFSMPPLPVTLTSSVVPAAASAGTAKANPSDTAAAAISRFQSSNRKLLLASDGRAQDRKKRSWS